MVFSADIVKDIQTQLDVCADETEQLNSWEVSFIESVSEQFNETHVLTILQRQVLERIYEKVV